MPPKEGEPAGPAPPALAVEAATQAEMAEEARVGVVATKAPESAKFGAKPGFPSGGLADPTKINTEGYSELANSRQLELMRWLRECFKRTKNTTYLDEDKKTVIPCQIYVPDPEKGDTALMTDVQLEAVENLNQLIAWETVSRANPDSGIRYKLLHLKQHYGTKSIVDLAEKIAIFSETAHDRTEGLGMVRMVMGPDRSKKAFGF